MNRITMEDVLVVVCERFKLSRIEFMGGRQSVRVAHPRQVAMMLCREFTDHSSVVIGHYLGGRDHSTVLFGVRAARARIEANPTCEEAFDVRLLRNILKQKQAETYPQAHVRVWTQWAAMAA